MTHPLSKRLEEKGVLVIDGGLATELERLGCDLDHPLWSARLLDEDPEQIRRVHLSYLEAGADLIVSSGYQASIPGFLRAGVSEEQARALYRSSVRLALDARDDYGRRHSLGPEDAPLVAASIGPYGACLADGSEYRGRYALGDAELEAFHRSRIEMAVHALREAGEAVLIGFETVPSLPEAVVLAGLLEEWEDARAWISFSCRDGESTSEGQSIAECARRLEPYAQIVAVGVNCTAPEPVPSLVKAIASASDKPIIAYPNSGERFEVEGKRWLPRPSERSLVESVGSWVEAGATIVGGCCRTTPDDIACMVKWVAEWRDHRPNERDR